jgi:DNA-binding NarL/FixJ family response regulator
VAIVDYSLPVLNGVQVTRQIRQRNPGTEVIIFTMQDTTASFTTCCGPERWAIC